MEEKSKIINKKFYGDMQKLEKVRYVCVCVCVFVCFDV